MSHVEGEALAAYWLGELDESAANALEEHVFGCDACAAAWTRARSMLGAVRGLIPPVISAARLAELSAQIPSLPQAVIDPGGQATARFGRGNDLFLLRLRADLQRAERVEFSIEDPRGPTLVELPSVPFDAETGAVLVVCQRHFVAKGFPRKLQMRLRGVEPGGRTVELGLYTVDHEFSV